MKNLIITLLILVATVAFVMDLLGQRPSNGVNERKGGFQAISEKSISEMYSAYNNWGHTGDAQFEIAPDLLAKNYYVVLDTSGSMEESDCVRSGKKMDAAKRSLAQWIQNVSPADNIGLMVFRHKNVEEILPLRQNSPAYREQFLKAMMKEYGNGHTPLGMSLDNAYGALAQQANSQLGYGEYHIVVVTDGEASDRSKMDRIVDQKIFNSPIILHTIGFCIRDNHALNQPGRSYYMSAMNEEELTQGLQGVLAESETFDISGFENLN